MKKTLALVLALAMLLSLVSVAVADEVPHLTVLVHDDSKITDFEVNNFTQFVESRNNVDLDFIVIPNSGADDKINMMIMSGETLPDVICKKTSDYNKVWKWAQTGNILDLTKYYEDPAYNENIVKIGEIVPGIYDYVRMPDGKYYSIPYYQRELHSLVHSKMWMNTKWLKDLNLEVPTTLQEFHDVLAAFKEAHPGCYPCLGSKENKQGDIILWIMEAFIYDDNEDHLIIDENGKLYPVYVNDLWKEALLFVRQLVDEGLYPVECFTMDRGSTMTAILQNGDENGECNVGCFLNGANNLFLESTPWWPDFDGITPLVGPYGAQYAHYAPAYAQNCWFITKDCKDPDLAARVGIAMWDPTEEYWVVGRYGVEGEDRVAPTNPNSCYEGFPALFEQLVDVWPLTSNKIWRNRWPGFCYLGDQGMMDTGDPTDWVHKIPQAVGRIYPYVPKDGEYVPKLLYTEEENDQISIIQAGLRDYVKESKIAFVTRDMSIEDEWDEFVETCWDMQLQEFLDVSQIAYERLIGK